MCNVLPPAFTFSVHAPVHLFLFTLVICMRTGQVLTRLSLPRPAKSLYNGSFIHIKAQGYVRLGFPSQTPFDYCSVVLPPLTGHGK